MSAETLRVDDAIAWPDTVDAGAWVEDLHRRCRIYPDQEDRIAVKALGMLAKAFRLAVHDNLELGASQDEDCDELAVEPEGPGQCRFDLPLDLTRWTIGAED